MADVLRLQCVGCKKKREMPIEEARGRTEQPCCDVCGMPEVVLSVSVGNFPSRASHHSS
jgi:hypothetical protein